MAQTYLKQHRPDAPQQRAGAISTQGWEGPVQLGSVGPEGRKRRAARPGKGKQTCKLFAELQLHLCVVSQVRTEMEMDRDGYRDQ